MLRSYRSSVELRGDLASEVGQHEVRARTSHGGELFNRDGRLVNPAIRARCFHHGVLATHVIRTDWDVERVVKIAHHVEVGHRRFHHDDVSTLGHVGPGFAQRLTTVAIVLLVALAIAPLDDLDTDGICLLYTSD